MHRIDTATATADSRFTSGDPAADIEATLVSDDWLNAVQEELADLIEGAGITLAKADNTQVRQAVQRLIGASVVPVGPASETAAGILKLASAAEAIAGAASDKALTPAGLAARTATEARAGIMELASVAEALAGLDVSRAVHPAGLAAAIAAAQKSDQLARNNAAMNAFVSHLAAGRASGPVPGGGLWTFASNELSGSGFTYDPAAHAYHNQTPSSVDHAGAINSGTPSVSGYTVVDTSVVIANGRVVTHVRIYATAASTGTIYVFQRTGAGAYTVVASGGYSHTGSGWGQFALSAAYTVPATGTYMVGAYSANFGACSYHTAGRAYKTGASSGSVTMSEDTTSGVAMGYAYLSASTNMELISSGLSLGFTPARAELYLLHKAVDSVTLNTDIIVSASRGAGWAVAADLAVLCQFDANYRLLRASFDLTGLAAGTSGLFKVETRNFKAQWVRGALLWGEAA